MTVVLAFLVVVLGCLSLSLGVAFFLELFPATPVLEYFTVALSAIFLMLLGVQLGQQRVCVIHQDEAELQETRRGPDSSCAESPDDS